MNLRFTKRLTTFLSAVTLGSFFISTSAIAFPDMGDDKKKKIPVLEYKLNKTKSQVDLALPVKKPIDMQNPKSVILNQEIKISDSIKATLTEYMAHAALKQEIKKVESTTGNPALRLTIQGKGETLARCLITNTPQKDVLATRIGRFEIKAYKNQAAKRTGYMAFQMSPMKAPILKISTPNGKTVSMLATVGMQKTLKDAGCSVKILEFYPHFNSKKKGSKSVNASNKMVNPAVKFQVEANGVKDERWAFALYPNFRSGSNSAIKHTFQLSCPVDKGETFETHIFAVSPEGIDLWTMKNKKSTSRAFKAGDTGKLAGMFSFSISDFEPSGELIESYSVSKFPRDPAAVKFSLALPGVAPKSYWLANNGKLSIPVKSETLELRFGPRKTGMAGMGAHGMGMPKGMPKGHGAGMPKGMGKMPKGHGMGMPKGHGAGMPNGHPKTIQPKKVTQ